MKVHLFLSMILFLHSCTSNSLKQNTNYINKQDFAQVNNTSLNQESKNSDSALLELNTLIQGKWKYEDNSEVALFFEGNKLYDYDSVVYTFEISNDSYLPGNRNDGIPYINGRSGTDSTDIFSWTIGNLTDTSLVIITLNNGTITRLKKSKQ